MPSIVLVNANAETIPLADGVVHAVVTSPPYYGLRKYAIDEDDPEIGLEETPELYLERMVAVFREVRRVLRDDGVCWVNMGDSYNSAQSTHYDNTNHQDYKPMTSFRSAKYGHGATVSAPGYKPLDLMNIPARLVLALQADGWYHRSTIIWSKPNPMPESVSGWRWERHRVKVAPPPNLMKARAYREGGTGTPHGITGTTNSPNYAEYTDCPGCEKCEPHGGLVLRRGSWRPTTAHEYIYMLTKTRDYWADGEAVREAHKEPWRGHGEPERINYNTGGIIGRGRVGEYEDGVRQYNPAGRNQRTVWDFPTQPWSGAHFATYPEELPRRCLKASISERGCCPECGAQWARVIDNPRIPDELRNRSDDTKMSYDPLQVGGGQKIQDWRDANPSTTLGWLPTCECNAGDPVPAIVLDPFAGSGTTLKVANKLGAHSIGLDLSYAYLHEQARERLGLTALDAWANGTPIEGTDADEYRLASKEHKNMQVPGRQPHSFHVARVKGKDGKVLTDLPLFSYD